MNGYNKVILIGTVGQDAEVKVLEGGNSVATLSLAINESFVDKNTGERKTKTEWVRIEAWKALATFLGNYGKKGTSFMVEGRIKTDSWEREGQTKYSTKVVADYIGFIGSKPSNEIGNNTMSTQTAPTQTAPTQTVSSNEFISGMQNEADDDLPF